MNRSKTPESQSTYASKTSAGNQVEVRFADVAPAGRAGRAARRDSVRRQQATSRVDTYLCMPNDYLSGGEGLIESKTTIEESKSKIPASANSHQSQPHVIPEIHHCPEGSSPKEPPALAGGVYAANYSHETRDSNLSDSSLNQKQRIKFPNCADKKAWKSINSLFATILPQRFSPRKIATTSTTNLALEFDEFLHSHCLEEFGPVPEAPIKPAFVPRPHRGLERLRKQKNKLKKERKALHKAGLKGGAADIALHQMWLALVRAHSRLSKAVSQKMAARQSIAHQKQFKKNPFAFGTNLFKNTSQGVDPAFSEKEAIDYFSRTYRDMSRSKSYTPHPEMIRPDLPEHVFTGRCPTLSDIKKSIRSKRNKAAAGLNSLTYVLYKCCPAILPTLHNIFKKIWLSRDVPASWAAAFIVLLSKSDVVNDPGEFRPIAITDTIGKLFFSILSSRLEKFMVHNKFIDNTLQKGFLSETPGCLEHTFTLYELMQNAKREKRQLVISWIDLANAYGSVRHNLIQFALNWYHVPKEIQELIFDYYEKLTAKVQTKAWTTGFFLFDIGLFQGCVLSTILFNCVFQLLLDMLKPLINKGYTIKNTKIVKLSLAYADDLSLVTNSVRGNQEALNRTDSFLVWTETMRAKPKKCISFAAKQFSPRNVAKIEYTKFQATDYSPFDPLLTIAGQKIGFMVTQCTRCTRGPNCPSGSCCSCSSCHTEPNPLAHDHFKFLGRRIGVSLNEFKTEPFVRKQFKTDIERTNKTGLNGLMKLWLYQHFIISRLSWPFVVHDFSFSFAKTLEKSISVQLKKWAGLFKGADTGALFRSRDNFGLQLTSVADHFVRMQLIRCCLLANSSDPSVVEVFQLKTAKVSTFKKKWAANNVFVEVSEHADFNQRFQSQSTKLGLGHGKYNNSPTPAERRTQISKAYTLTSEEKRLAHATSLARQGVWTTFKDSVNSFDLSWNNLIYGPGPRVISFVLNASINSVRTPDMLKLWGYKQSAACPLCEASPCTLHHILVNCSYALNQKRYNWRHDSVLKNIDLALRAQIDSHNAGFSPRDQSLVIPPLAKCFVREKSTRKPTPVIVRRSSILDRANDWVILVDYDSAKIVFPPHICATASRPDIIIWSSMAKTVILIELTCPAEEGIQAAHLRKDARYQQLLSDIPKPWNAELFTIEVGARGMVGLSVHKTLRKLGFSSQATKALCNSLSTVVARASCAIYLAYDSVVWGHNNDLIVLSDHVSSTSSKPTAPPPPSPPPSPPPPSHSPPILPPNLTSDRTPKLPPTDTPPPPMTPGTNLLFLQNHPIILRHRQLFHASSFHNHSLTPNPLPPIHEEESTVSFSEPLSIKRRKSTVSFSEPLPKLPLK